MEIITYDFGQFGSADEIQDRELDISYLPVDEM